MKLAYLTSRYPAVSHSFIRREIIAIEAGGHSIDRYSLRPPESKLPDQADRDEAAKTFVILDQGAAKLALAALTLLVSRPLAWGRALYLALSAAEPGWRGMFKNLVYFVEACFLLRCLRKRPVDHLHVHFGTNPATVARLCHRLGGPSYSFTAHGPDEFDAPRALDLAGKIADARATIGVSSFGRSQLMRWSKIADWPRIGIVRCGIDERFLNEDGAYPPPDNGHFCTVGRLSTQKGIPLLIEAAALLRNQGREFSLTIVGDGDLRRDIEKLIVHHDLGDRIVLAGSCDSAGVRRHLLEARVFVLPSFAEGLPVAIMEAFALRRPAIATAIAGTSELVDSSCGWLIAPGSVEALASAMAQALDTPADKIAEMGAIGRNRVLKSHDARRNGLALVDFLTETAG